MSTGQQPATSQSGGVTVTPGHVSPWWRNQVFAATVGAWILAYLNDHFHLGIPDPGTIGLGVGLALLWGVHTIMLDLEALRIANAGNDPATRTAAQAYSSMMAGIDAAIPLVLDQLRQPTAGAAAQPVSTQTIGEAMVKAIVPLITAKVTEALGGAPATPAAATPTPPPAAPPGGASP